MRRYIVCGMMLLGVLIVGLGWSSMQDAEAAPTGLLGWWPGDSNANDVSGNNHHATLQNGAQAGVSGLFNGAFHFDGVDDIAGTSLLLPPQGTLGLWVNPASLNTIDGIIGTFGKANGDDRLWLNVRGSLGGLGVDPNKLVVNTGDCCVNEIIADSPLAVGTWTHLALTFDYAADTYILYVNGYAVGLSTAPRQAPTGTLSFGGFSSTFRQTFFFNGLMDEVQLYSRVLNEAEIRGLATANPIPEPSTMLLLGTGLGGVAGYGWRRRKRVA